MNINLARHCRSFSLPAARIALFVVYVWFGVLKLFGTSPANPLVESLLSRTMPFMTFGTFIILLGIFEVLIGIAFVIPRMEKVALILLVPHLIVTTMPLFLLPAMTWTGPFSPTLEGQYIIKNILIAAVAISIVASISPSKESD